MNDKRNIPTPVGTRASGRGDLHSDSTASLDAAGLISTLQAGDLRPSNLERRSGQAKPGNGEGDPIRVAVMTDDQASFRSVRPALEELRARVLPGLEVDVIGTDASVDHRLDAVAELELPFYPGLRLGVPSPASVAEALTAPSYDAVHVCAPGPVGIAAALISRAMGVPVAGSYPTELLNHARVGSLAPRGKPILPAVLAAFYSQCRVVLSPNSAADASLARLGISAERTLRWDQGIDLERFNPAQQTRDLLPAGFNVLYVGELSRQQGVDRLAEAFLAARDRDPRLHLVLAGIGPEEPTLRRRLGSAATFLGCVDGDALARVYASADLFMFASTTDTLGQAITEAQASGLPVLAVDARASAKLIEDGRSGCLVAPDARVLASALGGLARREAIRDRLATGGRRAVRERCRKRLLAQLADGYARAIRAQHDSDRGIEHDAATTLEGARAA